MEVPLISCTQKIVLYETKARFYLVGSNNNETKFRVLKIDRTEARELAIHDDKVDYTQGEIKNLLTMIYHGNKTRASQRSVNGMSRSVSAYGIVGFVRFLEGYYIILITKRRKIALIGSHTIYKVEDTSMIYIPNDSVKAMHPDEARYEKLFQNVDLSSNFYFSYSYDLSHTLQYNMMPTHISSLPDSAEKKDNTRLYFFDKDIDGEKKSHEVTATFGNETSTSIEAPGQTFQDFVSLDNANDSYLPFHNVMRNQPVDADQDIPVYGVKNDPYSKFTWNKHLLSKFADVVHPDWVLYIIHGFIGQSSIRWALLLFDNDGCTLIAKTSALEIDDPTKIHPSTTLNFRHGKHNYLAEILAVAGARRDLNAFELNWQETGRARSIEEAQEGGQTDRFLSLQPSESFSNEPVVEAAKVLEDAAEDFDLANILGAEISNEQIQSDIEMLKTNQHRIIDNQEKIMASMTQFMETQTAMADSVSGINGFLKTKLKKAEREEATLQIHQIVVPVLDSPMEPLSGSVANEVETEQIVMDASETFLRTGRVSSFVQLRGSIPLYWSQDISSMMPKPPITLDQADPFAYVAGLHFNDCLKRYGAPIIVLNLVKTREKKRHESILSGEYRESIEYLNQFLPPQHAIQYIGFDMARINKRKDSNVLIRLGKIAKYSVRRTGFYFQGFNHSDAEKWNDDHLSGIQGFKILHGLRQTGVVRTNCVDCLDRTNTAQFAVGKCALAYQLYALGVISEPSLEFDTDCVRLLEELYEDQGDTLALQYGGSHLVHRIKGYRKIAPWTSHSLDIMRTLSRYYSNAFSDADKQHSINLFLGIFQPCDGRPNLWELATDYYLHNRQSTTGGKWLRKSYSRWWDSPVWKVLPLPYDEEAKGGEGTQMVIKTGKNDERVSGYWDYYKPYQLTSMDELFSFTIPSSVKNFMPKTAQDFSPFSRRIRPDRRHDENGTGGVESNPNVSGKESTASSTSTGSEDSTSSSSDSSDVDADIDLSDTSDSIQSDHQPDFVSFKKLPSTKEVYNFEISTLSRRTETSFKRYVEFEEASKELSRPHKRGIELFPVSAFKLDSSQCVEPPPVSRQSKEIYKAYILRGIYGPVVPKDQDMKIYGQYVNSKYM